MKCKRCGTLLTANTLSRCPKCAENKEKHDAQKYAGEFGVINRAFEIAVMPMKVSENVPEMIFLSVPLVVVLGLLVAAFVVLYSITILPVRLLYRCVARAI